MIFSGIELNADRFTCSPHGMHLIMNGTVEAGGKKGERPFFIQALIRKIRSMKGRE